MQISSHTDGAFRGSGAVLLARGFLSAPHQQPAATPSEGTAGTTQGQSATESSRPPAIAILLVDLQHLHSWLPQHALVRNFVTDRPTACCLCVSDTAVCLSVCLPACLPDYLSVIALYWSIIVQVDAAYVTAMTQAL